MEGLSDLALIALQTKISDEIAQYTGLAEKDLADYIIHIHANSKGKEDFVEQLKEVGAEDFPQSLIDSIDHAILTLHPKYKKVTAGNKKVEDGGNEKDRQARIFKGLAIPDKEVDYLEEDGKTETNVMDETFSMLAGLSTSTRKRNTSATEEQRTRPNKRYRRSRSRSSSRSSRDSRQVPDQGFVFQDEFGRDRTVRREGDRPSRRRYRDDDVDEFHRRKYYDDNSHGIRRPPTPELDDEPVLFKVYTGEVTGLKDFGAFVSLEGVRKRPDRQGVLRKVNGLVHVSQIQSGARVNHPSDLLSMRQEVKVKVIKMEGGKISLSMKDVDQFTGRDLAPSSRIASGANMQGLGGAAGISDHVPVIEDGFDNRRNGMRKRLTSPERWEIKQLIASGVIPRSDYPDIDEDYNAHIRGEGGFTEEEDVDIEVINEEPRFLEGQTERALELSPIRVVKAPDGALNRAAMRGDELARERRDVRQLEADAKAKEEAQKVDLSRQWNDPMSQQRQFASDLRNTQANQGPQAVPEWKKIAQHSKNTSFGKRTDMSIKDQRESLPVFKFRTQLLEAVQNNQILIVVGDTGSGKTTQMTQYLAEAGYANELMIGCTQPRRVAAMSVAKRVAEEVGCALGQEVGFTIRFDDQTSPATRIKYMTDGILQREILLDPMLNKYSCIMLDEAHERTIATDVLFGLLKKTLKRRPDMKLIVTSATLDAEKFSKYFLGAPIFTIPGRTFPVEIMYSKEPESDYLDAALVTVMQIHLTEPQGDILLFLTGREEIDSSCEILSERMKALGPNVPELMVLPIYSALPGEIASRIFEPAPQGTRKVVIATNIAETSLTIDGIYYVVDPGFVKQSTYDPKLGMDRLQIMPISKAQANQRSGRAGRTGPGKCFRLYTELAFTNEMLPTTIPEIQRQNLTTTILMLKAMGINDLLHFDFMDPPPTNTMLTALEDLYCLGALDDDGLLTRIGRQMADFPMDTPATSKALLRSVDMGCSDEVLTIVSMMSVMQQIFHRPRDKQQQADQKKAKFTDASGDHLTLLNVYNGWKNSGFSTPWCYENFIQPKTMQRARDIRQQLQGLMARHKHSIISCGGNTQKVRQALCSGFFRNSARKDPSEGYKTLVEGTPVYVHPSSAIHGKPAEFVIYSSLIETTKEWMSGVSVIEPKWLIEAAPTFFRQAPTDKLSKRKKAETIQPLHNKFAGEDDWRLSAQKRQGRGGGGTWG